MRTLGLKVSVIVCIFAFSGLFCYARAGSDNSSALQGIKEVSIYFDVSLKDDNLLVFRMDLLDKTIKQLEETGVKANVIVGFRGGASRFITKEDHYVLQEEVSNKQKIQTWVKDFTNRGIIVEQCALAADILDIPIEDFLSEISIVGNGYISLIGYQAQGYSIVPMD